MAVRPKVSVIMPAFNTEPYVADAIRSARAQTVRDIEILVVDDGSRDGTFAAALEAAAGDPRVTVWAQANAGTAAARNAAMNRASGEFFALLDSDDEWMPGFLECQLDALAHHPEADVATGNALNRGGVFDGTPYRTIQPEDRAISLIDMIECEDSICILSVFRRAVFETAGPMNAALRVNEDYEFWLRAAQHGFRFVQTFEPLAYYRRRPESASADSGKMIAGILRVFAMARERARTPDEARALDAQISRFERERRRLEGRAAAVAFASKHAPRLLLLAAHARQAIRRFRVSRAEVE